MRLCGLRCRPSLPSLLAWLQREQPDVVCLQELKAAAAAVQWVITRRWRCSSARGLPWARPGPV
ncbi:endonuclease/exonuclease/phosphatase family protein [Pseudomonas sp. B21-032]|uniref:endonuclease/exonuclease/phosphatase family protein n=1 Tax=Pseudomonas sp. B21-032 TaxID=2895483 RepID=UPI0038D41D7F